jgi:hypothetical protein
MRSLAPVGRLRANPRQGEEIEADIVATTVVASVGTVIAIVTTSNVPTSPPSFVLVPTSRCR